MMMMKRKKTNTSGFARSRVSIRVDAEDEEFFFPWSDLPMDVQTTILGWLPLRCLFRLKAVCKLWNTVISSPSFTHFPSLLPGGPSPWLIFTHQDFFDSLLVFDFTTRSWFTINTRFLSRFIFSIPRRPVRYMWILSSSTCGRFLLDVDFSSLHLCNPLTKSVATFPHFQTVGFPFSLGFTITRASIVQGGQQLDGHGDATSQTRPIEVANRVRSRDEYIVVVVGETTGGIGFEEFRSSRSSWVWTSLPSSSLLLSDDEVIDCNGLFYMLLLVPHGILVIGEGDETGGSNWRVQSLPDDPSGQSHCLVACQNTLFWLCTGDTGRLVIWRFQSETRVWVMAFNIMPPEAILEDVHRIELVRSLPCVGIGNYICFRRFDTFKFMTFDLSTGAWSWLPEVPAPYNTFYKMGLRFHPRLDYITTGL